MSNRELLWIFLDFSPNIEFKGGGVEAPTLMSSSSAAPSEHALRSALKRDPSRLGISDAVSNEKLDVSSISSPNGVLSPRSSSYSPSPGYTNKVSFDTFEGNSPADTSMFSFTLKVHVS